MRTAKGLISAAALGLCSAVFGQAEIILDNGSPSFSSTGTWPASTSVSGFYGSNYQTHEANGAPPGALVIDNTSAGFSVTGTWPASTSVAGFVGTNYLVHAANGEPPGALVADNASGVAAGTWSLSTAVSGYYGANYQAHAAGTGSDTFTWTLNVAQAGTYEVYARWTAHANRASDAKYTVAHAAGQTTVSVDQRHNNASWQLLGSWSFDAGAATVTLTDEANGYVIADAVMLVPPGAPPSTATWRFELAAAGQYNIYARWTAHANRATNAPFTVHHAAGATTIPTNQELGGGQWNLLGTFGFNAGQAQVTLTDQANEYVVADAVMITPPTPSPSTATWTPNVAQGGQYEIYARWTHHANRASNATYSISHAGGVTPVTVDQRANGGIWNLLGTFTLNPGTAHNVALTDQANGYVIADAIRLVQVSVAPPPGALYFIHVDHLNTPRLVANAAGQTVWQWDQQEPFGNNVADENPSGLGVFDLPIRLPGQYYDRETVLHYNARRDYDVTIGRYIQSDPIGIWGGLNTYGYVGNRPLTYIDPTGLRNIHGNWCGPGGSGPVLDPVDQCCYDHDSCYETCGATWRDKVFGTKDPQRRSQMASCDASMCACLDGIDPKNDDERRGKARVRWFFKCVAPPKGDSGGKRGGTT